MFVKRALARDVELKIYQNARLHVTCFCLVAMVNNKVDTIA